MDLKTLALGLLILNGLMAVHELGHFWVARWRGLIAPEFSLGIGPKLFAFTRGETTYTFRLLPIGGYVLLPDLAPEPDGWAMPVRDRFLTVLAGPLANLALVALVLGPVMAAQFSAAWVVMFYEMIRDLVLATPAPGSALLGPIGVSEVVGQAAALGWDTLLRLIALLSLSLGMFNLLPLPGLDGGRLVALVIEKLRGGRRSAWEPVIQGVGIMILFAFLGIWVTGREVLTYLGWL